MHSIGHVIIDGRSIPPGDASLSVFDITILRGYGCFEALRSYRGKPFRMSQHLDRLEASAEVMRISLPERAALEDWISDRAAAAGDGVVRVLVTGGSSLRSPGTDSSTIVFAEPLPDLPGTLSVMPLAAPWHPDGVPSELTGAKTLSYAPNIAAGLAAHTAGFDDALLVGRAGDVLEGPTYAVGWVSGGTLCTPTLELGILESITRAATLEVAARSGIAVSEGRFTLEALEQADEAFAMSTVKEVMAISQIGDHVIEPGPVTERLGAGYRELVQRELGL